MGEGICCPGNCSIFLPQGQWKIFATAFSEANGRIRKFCIQPQVVVSYGGIRFYFLSETINCRLLQFCMQPQVGVPLVGILFLGLSDIFLFNEPAQIFFHLAGVLESVLVNTCFFRYYTLKQAFVSSFVVFFLGFGVFTTKSFLKGEFLLEYFGGRKRQEELNAKDWKKLNFLFGQVYNNKSYW